MVGSRREASGSGRVGALRAGALAVLALACLAAAPVASAKDSAAQPFAPRINGGGPVAIEQVPWQARLAYSAKLYQGSLYDRGVCGGSLIAPNMVVTAAHCVYNTDPARGAVGFIPANQFQVTTGRTIQSQAGGQTADVSAIYYFVAGGGSGRPLARVGARQAGAPLYNPTTYEWDAVILQLATPSSSPTIQIAGPDERKTWSAGRQAFASGWGSVSQTGSVQSDQLNGVAQRIMGDKLCSNLWGQYFFADVQVCAGGEAAGAIGTCRGDSGGPLVVPVEVGNTTGFRLIGDTSIVGTSDPEVCNPPRLPDLYGKLADDPIRAAVQAGVTQLGGPGVVGAGARPLAAPKTQITKKPRRKVRARVVRFRFSANEPATFSCKLDNKPFEPCAAKIEVRAGRGKHKLKVRATDQLGQTDETAAKARWKVKGKRRR